MMDIAAVLLCAGKGSRMNDDSTNKVCFLVNGIPAVKRTVENMKKCGINKFVVVVGHKAEKVMECLSSYKGICYAFQAEQKGTGNAALVGLETLKTLGYDGPALILMGDKIISETVISSLIEKYRSSNAKTVFAVQPKAHNPSGGRIVVRDSVTCGIFEMTDSYLLKLGALSEHSVISYECALADSGLNDNKKAKVIKYALDHDGELPSSVVLNGNSFTFEDIESMEYVNTATYICDVNLTTDAINSLNADNAQGEIYLTDAVNLVSASHPADLVVVNSKEDMLTFATQDDLKEVSRYFEEIEKE